MEFYEKVNRIAKTEKGEIEGIPGNIPQYTVFKGIPYAKAPVGELRWKQKSGKAFIMQIISDRLRRRCATRKAVCMVMNFSSPQKI
jgi:carboxylesterase type B